MMKPLSLSIVAGAGCLCAASLLACSSLLGFADLTSGSDASAGSDATGDATSDATNDTTSGGDGAPSIAPDAPSNVVAAPALVTTLAGSGAAAFADGAGLVASFNAPVGVAVDAAGNVYVADSLNHRIRKVTPAGVVSTLAGSGAPAFAEGTGGAASFNTPSGVTLDSVGDVYVADTLNHRIRKVTPGGVVSTFAGSGTASHFDGTGAGADFSSPGGVTVDSMGLLYVADTGNHRIRRVTTAGDVVSVVGGSGNPTPGFADGQDSVALFHTPTSVAAAASGNVFIADSDNHRIRALATNTRTVTTPAGSATATFADGTGAAAGFDTPRGVAADATGNAYIADSLDHRIRKMTPAGQVTTIAGSGAPGFADGTVDVARFDTPGGIAAGGVGTFYVGDTNNHRIRKIVALGPGQLVVAWNAPAAAGSSPIVGYTASASAAGKASGTCTVPAPATSCTITGLASGVVYTLSVIATSGALTSAPSASTAATPN
jgi:sugar lactone lactonase YvrE